MRQLAAAMCLLLLSVFAGFTQEPEKKEPAPPAQAQNSIPAEAAKRENPVKPTESSIAEGRKLFRYQCAMCHGENGDGKGDLVETMGLKVKDWTNPESLKNFTDGAMFYTIEKGKGHMPAQEGRMTANQKWNLVNFIRSFAKKPADAPKPAPEKP